MGGGIGTICVNSCRRRLRESRHDGWQWPRGTSGSYQRFVLRRRRIVDRRGAMGLGARLGGSSYLASSCGRKKKTRSPCMAAGCIWGQIRTDNCWGQGYAGMTRPRMRRRCRRCRSAGGPARQPQRASRRSTSTATKKCRRVSTDQQRPINNAPRPPSSPWSADRVPRRCGDKTPHDDIDMEREHYQHQFEGGPRARPKRRCCLPAMKPC